MYDLRYAPFQEKGKAYDRYRGISKSSCRWSRCRRRVGLKASCDTLMQKVAVFLAGNSPPPTKRTVIHIIHIIGRWASYISI